jgi:hypothetical protein
LPLFWSLMILNMSRKEKEAMETMTCQKKLRLILGIQKNLL